MNKALILFGILLASILIVTNFATGSGTNSHIIIGYTNSWTLSIVSIWVWLMLGFGIKWFIYDKSMTDYSDDDWINF